MGLLRILLPAALGLAVLLPSGARAAGKVLVLLDPGGRIAGGEVPEAGDLVGFLRNLHGYYQGAPRVRTEGIEDRGATLMVDGTILTAFRTFTAGGVRISLYTDLRRPRGSASDAQAAPDMQGLEGEARAAGSAPLRTPRAVQAIRLRSTDDDEGEGWLGTMIQVVRAADDLGLPDGSIRLALALAARIEDHKVTATVEVAVVKKLLPWLAADPSRRLGPDRPEVEAFESVCHELDMDTGWDLTSGAAGDRLARRGVEALEAILWTEAGSDS